MTHCRSCDAEIVWAQTVAGRPHPLDPGVDLQRGNMRHVGVLAHSRGTIVVEKLPNAEVGQPTLDADEKRYVSHFVTCPDSRDWSKN